MRSAIIKNGIVKNLIKGQVEGSMTCGPEVGIGWLYDGGDFIAPPKPKPPAIEEQRTEMSLSFAQLLIGLVTEGWITEAEGDRWLEGKLPPAMNGLIGQLPREQRFAAKARAARPSTVLRNDPLVSAMAAAQGKSPEELDAFFRKYAEV